MSKKTGFCIRRDDHALVGVSVVPQGSGWLVADLHRSVPDGKLSRDLQTAMSKATTPVTWLLADGESGMSHLNMPKLRGKALARAFAGGLARDNGGQPDNWRTAWKALSQKSGQEVQPYILHHASKEIVDKYVYLTGDWSVDLQRMMPGHLALDLFYRTHGPARAEHAVWNLVFVGKDQQFLCVATQDAQLMVRNLPANLSTDGELGEYLSQLATEIERSSFFARQTENSPEVEKIIVCGDPALAAPLVETLGESSDIPAVHWPIEDMFQWGLNEQNPDDLVTLAGAVLALEKVPFNLLPDRGQLYFGRSLRRQMLVAATTCAAAIVPVLLVGGVLTAKVQGTYLERAESRLSEARDRARQAEQIYDTQRVLLARENHIRHFAQNRPDFESILLRLAAITPPEVVFKDLQVREKQDGRFVFQMQAESRAASGVQAQGAFLTFLAALDACDFLTRLGEPRLMQIIPGAEDKQSGGVKTMGKTTVFHLELEWRGTAQGAS